eukprot:1160224-Pelagomonas_calceolata.AAC.6
MILIIISSKSAAAMPLHRMEALPIVDSITKRFPQSIARTCLPHFLCALADVPPPPELTKSANGHVYLPPCKTLFLTEACSKGPEGAGAGTNTCALLSWSYPLLVSLALTKCHPTPPPRMPRHAPST